MEADPGQKNDLAGNKPDVVNTLYTAYEQWFRDVSAGISTERAIPVGHPGRAVELPAHEAVITGDLQFKEEKGYAHDWLTGWKNENSKAYWDIEVVSPGKYQVHALYNAREEAVGAAIHVVYENKPYAVKIKEPYQSPVFPSPDRVKRIEAYEKAWKLIAIGSIYLSKGKYKLWFSCSFPNRNVSSFELKGLKLARQEP
jgi:arylsulfatase A